MGDVFSLLGRLVQYVSCVRLSLIGVSLVRLLELKAENRCFCDDFKVRCCLPGPTHDWPPLSGAVKRHAGTASTAPPTN